MTLPSPGSRLPLAGKLPPCPTTPNCVATAGCLASQRMDPWPMTGTPAQTLARLEQIIGQMPRTKIVDRRPEYLKAEVTSRLFRFVDDLEFLIDLSTQQVHFRSASRTGKYDFGANRKRILAIQAAYRDRANPSKRAAE